MPKTVVVFSTPSCPWCRKAKDFLTKNGVSFVDRDVQNNEGARQEMLGITEQMGVPVIVIDGQIVIGFEEKKLRSLLGL